MMAIGRGDYLGIITGIMDLAVHFQGHGLFME
jgi:hypothetical protein